MSYIQTVTGKIDPSELGFTLMHEHILWDQTCYHDPIDESDPENAFLLRKICIEDLGRIRGNMHAHRDNTIHTDPELSAREISLYAANGGRSFVDCSVYGCVRYPAVSKAVSEKTGVQIIQGTGFYIGGSSPEVENFSVAEKEALMLKDLTEGMDDTDVKAGYMGELGVSECFVPSEVDTLTAAGRVHARTGAAIIIHQPGLMKYGHKILDILQNNGADLKKVQLSHCDPLLDDFDYLRSLADRGATLCFDQFALEFHLNIAGYRGVWLPRDADRIRTIARLCELGYSRQVTMSMDLCFKVNYETYGGYGYRHIPKTIIPLLKESGVTDEQIHTITVETPARLLSI